MPDYTLFQKTLRAASLGKSQEAGQLHDQIVKSELVNYYAYIVAFFSVCLEARFTDDSSPEAIRAFGDEMRYDYRNAEPPVKQHVVEGLIRGMAGEEHLLKEISPEDQHMTQLMVIRKIVGESPKLQEDLGKYLAEAVELAREWDDKA